MPTDLVLNMCHLSSYIRENRYDAPINITLNGHEICKCFAPQSHGMKNDKFGLDQSILKVGKNIIRVDYAAGGQSNYWIKTLAVISSNQSCLQFFCT